MFTFLKKKKEGEDFVDNIRISVVRCLRYGSKFSFITFILAYLRLCSFLLIYATANIFCIPQQDVDR
jgi:hypothetical protein